MRFLSSAQFIERSEVADEFIAPSAALANRLLAARVNRTGFTGGPVS
jgi:hypothetical protein